MLPISHDACIPVWQSNSQERHQNEEVFIINTHTLFSDTCCHFVILIMQLEGVVCKRCRQLVGYQEWTKAKQDPDTCELFETKDDFICCKYATYCCDNNPCCFHYTTDVSTKPRIKTINNYLTVHYF